MIVFKFGGASVKNPESVRNVADILRHHQDQKLVVVVSAMGKMTNAFEKVVDAVYNALGTAEIDARVDVIKVFHYDIMQELFAKGHAAFSDVDTLFEQLISVCSQKHIRFFDQVYDQIVCFGELLSTKIMFHFLEQEGFSLAWKDARKLIRTDANYRDALVDWVETEHRTKGKILQDFEKHQIVLSQGFIAGNEDGLTTTLGREGSDYTGAIFAHVMDAENLTIWKDVPGLLNADPKYFDDTVLLEKISYKETIELAFYGASIIHPKTIKPLQNKNIPLLVKSFVNPQSKGSVIQNDTCNDCTISSVIIKRKQVLLSILARDFSFVDEKNISLIYAALARNGVKVNLMQNSAISLSICVDQDEDKIASLIVEMKDQFKIRFNQDLHLITIRYYNDENIEQLIGNKEVLLEQKSRITAQYIVKP